MQERSEIAQRKFQEGYNCSQSVLLAFEDLLGLDEKTLLGASRGFGAGMGRKEEVCGAVTGGILALGLCLGRSDEEEEPKREATYRGVSLLMSEFQSKFKTYLCRELLDGCDLNTAEGRARFKEEDMRKRVCLRCVAESAMMTERLVTI